MLRIRRRQKRGFLLAECKIEAQPPKPAKTLSLLQLLGELEPIQDEFPVIVDRLPEPSQR